MRQGTRTKPKADTDRRAAPRVDVGAAYGMRLDPCDGREPLECAILDFSVIGARLRIADDVPLPQDVKILIGALSHDAKVVWRADGVIGIDFVDEHHSLYYDKAR
jgi:hypothetical protein